MGPRTPGDEKIRPSFPGLPPGWGFLREVFGTREHDAYDQLEFDTLRQDVWVFVSQGLRFFFGYWNIFLRYLFRILGLASGSYYSSFS